MPIRVGEVGKIFRLGTSFDLSASTALSLVFTKPDKTKVTITDPRVTAPNVTVVEPAPVGELLQNTYMQFTTIATDFDQEGSWSVCGIYNDGTPKTYMSERAVFDILAGC